MPKRYGGVKNARKIDEIEEATVYTKPPVSLSKKQKTRGLFILLIKLLPISLLIGLILWGASFIYLKLTGA